MWAKRALVGLAVVVALLLFLEFGRAVAPMGQSDFTAKTMDGESWTLSEHLGNGPVIVNFFATWCGPCRMELPHLMEMQQELRDRGLQVVTVTREPASVIRQFPPLFDAPITVLVDGDEAFDNYRVSSIPHTLYFDEGGTLTHQVEGFDERALRDLERRIRALPARQARL